MTDFYLIDNPPVRSQFGSRSGTAIDLIVVHTSEQPADVTGADGGADALAAYVQRRPSAGCYHTIADSDSVVNIVPPEFACWGSRFVNKRALHISHSVKSANWEKLHPDYVTGMLSNSARVVAGWLDANPHIPMARIRDTAGIQSGVATGICAHGDVDPTRRTDPGATFPWDRWLALIDSFRANSSRQGPYGPLNAPIVDSVMASSGQGYLLGEDGGVFTLGGARYHGSAANDISSPCVSLVTLPGGYFIVTNDGGIFTYGSAQYPEAHREWYGDRARGKIVSAFRSAVGGLVVVEANGTLHQLD